MNTKPICYLKHAGTMESMLPFNVETIQGRENDDQPRRSSHFEIWWIIKGTGMLNIDLQQRRVGEADVLCLKPGQVRQLTFEGKAEGYVITFKASFLDPGGQEFDGVSQSTLTQLFSGHNSISLREDMLDDMQEVIDKMIKELLHDYAFKMQVLKRFLKVFLIYLIRQFESRYQPVRQTRELELVQGFLNSLEQNFRQEKMVVYYARQLYVTPNYLNEIIKKNTGYPASYHIRQRVALEAKRMGRYSGSCMKQIAYSLGFLDSAHFSKFFKATTGSNFSDFKKELFTYSAL